MIQRIKESVTFALNNFKYCKPKATIGKPSGVMSHLLNKDFQIHHIDQMHHIGLIDHILHIDTISRILIVYTLVIAQIEFL